MSNQTLISYKDSILENFEPILVEFEIYNNEDNVHLLYFEFRNPPLNLKYSFFAKGSLNQFNKVPQMCIKKDYYEVLVSLTYWKDCKNIICRKLKEYSSNLLNNY